VNPTCGGRLVTLPEGEPVWVVASPANEAVSDRLRRGRPPISHLTGITTFRPGPISHPDQDLVAILGILDLHHGGHSADPPYSALEVVGCHPTGAIHSALAEFGFSVVSLTSKGFVAERLARDA